MSEAKTGCSSSGFCAGEGSQKRPCCGSAHHLVDVPRDEIDESGLRKALDSMPSTQRVER